MKKRVSLILAVLLIVALFAACGQSNTPSTPTAAGNSPAANPTATASGSTGTDIEDPEPVDEGPYNLAAGKYQVNDQNLPIEPYDYELPMSTAGEVFTYWTTCYTPQMISEEGFTDMPYQKALRENTGVNIEYDVIPSSSMSENFSVLIASDDLRDVMTSAYYYYRGSALQAIEDGWFINFNDYREYIPNFLYQIVRQEETDPDGYDKVFYNENTIRALGMGLEDPMPGTGYCVRGDWLERVGLKAEDITTYDEIHNMLTLFKTLSDDIYPMALFSAVELQGGAFLSGFNTSATVPTSSFPAMRVIDGAVQYTLTRDDDKAAAELIRQWISEGLVDPNWGSYSLTTDIASALANNTVGYMTFNPSEIKGMEAASTDPNCDWVGLVRPRQYEGQVLQFGQGVGGVPSGIFGATISTKCANIPLMVSYLDYGYSPEGSLFLSWGVQGVTWDYDENGNRMLSDFALNNPNGFDTAWLLMVYAANPFSDPMMNHHLRAYAYPGGEELVSYMRDIWLVKDYGGEYDWPSSIRLPDDLSMEISTFATDVGTFISENYTQFIDGSKPFTEWDAYVQSVMDMGMARAEEIYTNAYQEYLERKAARG